jgi:ABC-type histidine transport system ATPase subunit
MIDIPPIRVVDLRKNFGALEVLRGVSFEVRRGSVVSMIGASGSGKSTLLRCINRLEIPTSGEVYIEGEPMGIRPDGGGPSRARPLNEINRMRRDLGMVFQQFNLWPHMTVLGNVIEAPVRARPPSRWEKNAWPGFTSRRKRTSIRPNCPAGSSSGSRSRARWRCSPRRCCSTSQPPPSIRS